MVELPSTPWQAPQTAAFSLPAAASCATAQTGSRARRASNARSFFISFTLSPALSRQGRGSPETFSIFTGHRFWPFFHSPSPPAGEGWGEGGSKRRGRLPAAPLDQLLERRCRQKVYGSANTKMLLPRLKSSWLLPPAATAMYCLPPASYDTAGEFTPAPHWNDHSFLPLRAS